MTNNLYDPAAMLEAEALNHRAWCDPSQCCLTPAITPLWAPPVMFHQTTYNASYAGENFKATITEYLEPGASEQKPLICLTPCDSSRDISSITAAIMDKWDALEPSDFIAETNPQLVHSSH